MTGMNKGRKKYHAGSERVGAWRMFCWQSRAVSMGCNMLIFGFLAIYCTDTLKMPAALVGTLMMVSKIFDGFTDLIAGYVVDRTNTKWGRGRPYEWCIVGAWLCTWLLFSCPPEFSLVVKSVWVFIMYSLINSIFVTFLNANSTVYMLRAFHREEHYIAIQSYGSIITFLFVIVFNVSFPILMGNLATSAAGWSTLVAIYALPLGAFGMLRFFFVKEENKPEATVSSEEKINIKSVLQMFKINPYIFIIALVTLSYNLITNMGVVTYYYEHIMNDVALLGIVSLAPIIVLPVTFFFPKLTKMFSIKKLILIGILISCVGLLVNFFAYQNFGLLMIGAILVGLGGLPLNMLIPLLIIDCVEYNEWKGSARLEGTLSSVNGFAAKIGSAFGVGLMGILLSIAKYDAIGDIASVPDSAIMMIRLLHSVIPMILYMAVAFAMTFYKLDRNIDQIKEENKQRRQMKDEVHNE